MPRPDRHGGGFTLPELLVVLMILGTVPAFFVPNFKAGRIYENQFRARIWMDRIHTAEQTFRSTNADGDGLDDYGTLAELVAASLIQPAISDGQEDGYDFPLILTATPFFEAWANPVSCETGVLRLYVDPSGIIRFNATQPAGPSDPELPPGGEYDLPESPADDGCDRPIEMAISQSIAEILGLSQQASLAQAIDLAAVPGVVDAVVTRLDADADEQLSMAEYVTDDLLAVARQVANELGNTGPAVGADSDLVMLLESHQAWLAAYLDLEVDAPQPALSLLDLYGHQGDVVAYLQSLLPAVPALGPWGLAALAAALVLGAKLLPRAR